MTVTRPARRARRRRAVGRPARCPGRARTARSPRILGSTSALGARSRPARRARRGRRRVALAVRRRSNATPAPFAMLRGDVVRRADRARRRARRSSTADDAPRRAAAVEAPSPRAHRGARPARHRRSARTSRRELALLARGVPRSRARDRGAAGPDGIIGMGKLGGGELNYASDVDVLFVHEGDGATPRPNAPRARCCAS